MSKKDWETDGTKYGEPVYCPIVGDCPYRDKDNQCHIADPIEDCDDFGMFCATWEDWLDA